MAFGTFNSNGNAKIERQIRTLRGFFNRLGKPWSTPDSIYKAQIFLNCFTGTRTDETTPFERHNLWRPPIHRILRMERATPDDCNAVSTYDACTFANSINKTIHVTQQHKKVPFEVGDRIFYKRKGVKDSTPLPGTIHRIYESQASIWSDAGNLISRNFKDILM